MIKFLDIISKITKYCFYGLMLFFGGILLSILLGYFKFVQSQVPFYFMTGVACVALISLISSDLLHKLKKNTVTTLIPEALEEPVEEPVEETETQENTEEDTEEEKSDDSSK